MASTGVTQLCSVGRWAALQGPRWGHSHTWYFWQWFACGLFPKDKDFRSLVSRVMALGDDVESLRCGVKWEVLRSLGILPLERINAVLMGPLSFCKSCCYKNKPNPWISLTSCLMRWFLISQVLLPWHHLPLGPHQRPGEWSSPNETLFFMM